MEECSVVGGIYLLPIGWAAPHMSTTKAAFDGLHSHTELDGIVRALGLCCTTDAVPAFTSRLAL